MLVSAGDLGDFGEGERERRRRGLPGLGDNGDFGDFKAVPSLANTFSFPLVGDMGLTLW